MRTEFICKGCEKPTLRDNRGYRTKGKIHQAKFCSTCAEIRWKEWKRQASKRHYNKNRTSQAWLENKRSRFREIILKSAYGIDSDIYAEMLKEQGGVCASCSCPEVHINKQSGEVVTLAVDHDHETGKPRALLCKACNLSFGLLLEDPQRIKSLLLYAERWNENQ